MVCWLIGSIFTTVFVFRAEQLDGKGSPVWVNIFAVALWPLFWGSFLAQYFHDFYTGGQ